MGLLLGQTFAHREERKEGTETKRPGRGALRGGGSAEEQHRFLSYLRNDCCTRPGSQITWHFSWTCITPTTCRPASLRRAPLGGAAPPSTVPRRPRPARPRARLTSRSRSRRL